MSFEPCMRSPSAQNSSNNIPKIKNDKQAPFHRFMTVKKLSNGDFTYLNTVYVSNNIFLQCSTAPKREIKREEETPIYLKVANYIFRVAPLEMLDDDTLGVNLLQHQVIEKYINDTSDDIEVFSYKQLFHTTLYKVDFSIGLVENCNTVSKPVFLNKKELDVSISKIIKNEILRIGHPFFLRHANLEYQLQVTNCHTSEEYGICNSIKNIDFHLQYDPDEIDVGTQVSAENIARYIFTIEPSESAETYRKSIIARGADLKREINKACRERKLIKIDDTIKINRISVKLNQVNLKHSDSDVDSKSIFEWSSAAEIKLIWDQDKVIFTRKTIETATNIDLKLLSCSKTHNHKNIIGYEDIVQRIKAAYPNAPFFKGEHFSLNYNTCEFVVEVESVKGKTHDNKIKRVRWRIGYDTTINIKKAYSLGSINLIKNENPPLLKDVEVAIEYISKRYDDKLPDGLKTDFTKVKKLFDKVFEDKSILIIDKSFELDETSDYRLKGTINKFHYKSYQSELLLLPDQIKLSGTYDDTFTKVIFNILNKDIEKRTAENLSSPTREIKESEEESKSKLVKKPRLDPIKELEKHAITGLSPEVEKEIRSIFRSRGRFAKIQAKRGVKTSKGILFYGPPGTGKSQLARAISKTLGAKRVKFIAATEILNRYIGVSEESIRDLFKDDIQAYKDGKDEGSVIIIDEIEAIFGHRGQAAKWYDTMVSQFLTLMDGGEELPASTLVIGMTNKKEALDPAVIREGRLDKHIFVGLPDRAARKKIFEVHTIKMKETDALTKDVDFDNLAALTENWTGASIVGCIEIANSYSTKRMEELPEEMDDDEVEKHPNSKVTAEDFKQAIAQINQKLPSYSI